jgi:hypothetical protein
VTALAQGSAGIALVMCFGLLGTRRVAAASIMVAIQSLAVAVAALAQHQPLIAAATAIIDLVGASWFLSRQRPLSGAAVRSAAEPPEPPISDARLGILLGAALAVLCQSCGSMALPLAVVLLSVLLAATRHHRLMPLVAVVSLQNGVALAASLQAHAPLHALACFVLPPLFAAGLAWQTNFRHDQIMPARLRGGFGWVQLAAALGMFLASLAIPLDPLAAIFAPLIAAWGIAEAWAVRHRIAQDLPQRLAALAKLAFMLVAIAATDPVFAWLAVTAAMSAALFPTFRRRQGDAALAFCASGLAIFGLLAMPLGLPSVSYTCLLIGYAAIAAVVPELAVIVVLLILRLMIQAHLPPIALDILTAVAVAGLLICALPLILDAGLIGGPAETDANRTEPRRLTLAYFAQTSIAAVALGLDLPDARLAALVTLILLILTRCATRISQGPAASAGLGGIPLIGVLPGLVLVLLAASSHAPWLLLPIGLGLCGVIATCFPARHWSRTAAPLRASWTTSQAAGLVPLALALVLGFFAPDGMIDWLRAVTAGPP